MRRLPLAPPPSPALRDEERSYKNGVRGPNDDDLSSFVEAGARWQTAREHRFVVNKLASLDKEEFLMFIPPPLVRLYFITKTTSQHSVYGKKTYISSLLRQRRRTLSDA